MKAHKMRTGPAYDFNLLNIAVTRVNDEKNNKKFMLKKKQMMWMYRMGFKDQVITG